MIDDPDEAPSVDPVTQQLDELAGDANDEASLSVGSAAARRLIDAGGWEW